MQLELKQLKIDGGTQPRVTINEETVTEYAEALRSGAAFPPVVVFSEGSNWWLADGFHRYFAHKRAGAEKIEADVREGTLRDAILYSVGANTEHGLRRTNEDKRKAVTTMLTNELVAKNRDGSPWSDREIAGICRVDHKTVGGLRKALCGEVPQIDSPKRAVKRGTQTYVQDTSKIRRANTKRRKPAGVSPDALKPIRPHSQHFARTAIDLPHDPKLGASAIVSAMGPEYVRLLIPELTSCLEGAEA